MITIKDKMERTQTVRGIGPRYVVDVIMTTDERTNRTKWAVLLYQKTSGKVHECDISEGERNRQKDAQFNEAYIESMLSLGSGIDWAAIQAPQGGAPNWNAPL